MSLCDPDYNDYCYPSHRGCHYDTYKGFTLYCKNFEHLYYCDDYECPHMYKCPMTYCIPLRLVCDSTSDCPDGDDETFCTNLTCPGLLR